MAFKCAIKIFEISKTFPREEKYFLTDQISRSSRSVTSNIAEAFRKRSYPKAFITKLNDSEGEAAETQVWLEYYRNNVAGTVNLLCVLQKYKIRKIIFSSFATVYGFSQDVPFQEDHPGGFSSDVRKE